MKPALPEAGHGLQSHYESKPAEYYDGARSEMLRFVPLNAKRILDVGCASGKFGAALKRRTPCTVIGVEPGEAATEARKYLDHVYQSTLEDITDAELGQFDCVVFNDVLEHMLDPASTLRRAVSLLRHDAVVVASIPNVRHIDVVRELVWDAEWRYRESGVLDVTHLRFFTPRSMRRLFFDANLTVERQEPLGWTEFPCWMSVANRLLGRRWSDLHHPQFAIVGRAAHRT